MSKSKKEKKYDLNEVFNDMNKMLEALGKFETKLESIDQINENKDNLESVSKNILKKYNKENLDSKK